jgi:hypothetical protein
MTQFATMIPFQGSTSTLTASSDKATASPQTELEGGGEGLSFEQALLEMSETNPNAAALLLALQQSEVVNPLPLSLQMGGSGLPLLAESGGNPLPQPQLQLQSLQLNPLPEQPTLDVRQLQQLVGEKPVLEPGQLFTEITRTGLVTEEVQTLEGRSLGDFSHQLQGLGSNLQTGGTTVSLRSVPALQMPVGQPGWDDAVGDRIQWMMSRNIQQAEIKLTPPELGPMEIKISLQNDQTHVQFLASHSATREALESAIPRLRELFGEINLNLANVDVNQQESGGAFAEEGSGESNSEQQSQTTGEGYELLSENDSSSLQQHARGLLDTYA